MPGANVDVTTKTTVVFATSGFTAEIMSIGFPSISRESIDTSHFASTLPAQDDFGSKTFIPACLTDAGEFTMEIHFNPITTPPIERATESITVTWPLSDGDTTSTIWTFDGFVTGEDMTGPLDDKMTATITVKITGDVVLTFAT